VSDTDEGATVHLVLYPHWVVCYVTIASNFEATICLKGGISLPARLVDNGSSSCVDSKLQFMLKAIGIKVSHLRTAGQAVIERAISGTPCRLLQGLFLTIPFPPPPGPYNHHLGYARIRLYGSGMFDRKTLYLAIE